MYDRVFTQVQEVRDFIKFYYRPAAGGEKVWPLFNLADAFICVGVFLLTFEMMFFDERNRKPDEPAKIEPSIPAGPVAGPGPVVEGK
jgi:lipoprotein signal peptidase